MFLNFPVSSCFQSAHKSQAYEGNNEDKKAKGDFIPTSEAPYTRKYQHTQSRGHESLVTCGYCGRQVPRYKTFIKYTGFRITDPIILQQVDRSQMHMFNQKMYVCPSCARFHKVVQRGKSVQKKHLNRNKF